LLVASLGTLALHLARQRQRGPAHLDVVALGLDPDVDVDCARAAGLREPGQAVVVQHLAHAHRHLAHLGEAHLGGRIKVNPQLVGTVEVGTANRMRVEVDHPEVHGPDQVGGVVDLRHLEVVVGEVELGVSGLREVDLVGVGELHLPPRGLDRRVAPLLRHPPHIIADGGSRSPG
jgi:hypothetical protein